MVRPDTSGSELGRYLKLLRIKNNLTMMQTAESTGITQGYISQIENGIYTPSAKTLAKLARAYKMPEIQLLRKAGIVQLSSTAPSVDDLDREFNTNLFPSEPLVEFSDSRELMDLLKRGLISLEYLSDQIRQRGQVASLPASPVSAPGPDDSLLGDMLLPVYDASWQPLSNIGGEPAAYRLPASLCADDQDAFVLMVVDNAMAPLVRSGDWVVISPATEPASGHVVAVNDRNQIHLRNYMMADKVLILTALNPEYSNKTLVSDTRTEKVEIIGRALRIVNREL